jgi:hypothetical protein
VSSYVILTSKPGKCHTEAGAGLRPLEAYDYVFYGRMISRHVIAELNGAARVRVVDEAPPFSVNDVPIKFLAKFATIEAARRELDHLVSFGRMETSLRRLPMPDQAA